MRIMRLSLFLFDLLIQLFLSYQFTEESRIGDGKTNRRDRGWVDRVLRGDHRYTED